MSFKFYKADGGLLFRIYCPEYYVGSWTIKFGLGRYRLRIDWSNK